ncbi:peptide ABC transporter substrate-binding protein [Thalassospira lucentensis]|uniref:Peptide ABC transporter substrate-binding protein n=1 Tax=Thalassospira lucentensis TaxID=168935 RepID=A0A154LBV4_9PROT|nr:MULTISPECIES: ABC transporter substrate-binding protein [Thalassospira]KZB68234.1 peptide ABC transporter substrate-binding protein [Thalassospira lucentensis]MCH2274391.1 ABC transporter substrate-binding protein [Thalassospira sp.]
MNPINVPAFSAGWFNRSRNKLARTGLGAMMLAGIISLGSPAQAEIPYFKDAVSKGELPPMAERLPEHPKVIDFTAENKEIGKYGGDLVTIMGRSRDIRMAVVYAYTRLIGYEEDLNLKPDILESLDVNDAGNEFTLHIRKGHKWSDGEPFTAEDFRYFWEDIVNNDELFPVGPPRFLFVGDEPATFEVLDEYTVRYSWSQPNPFFLTELAATRPPFIYRPAHYLKQFHENYRDAAELDAIVKKRGLRSWAVLHTDKDRPYRLENIERPSLEPWLIRTEEPSDRFIFERNPYYHRVDPDGNQLPYIDRMIFNISNAKLVPAKVGAGEVDLQSRILSLQDYTFLKQSEPQQNFKVNLWDVGYGAYAALYPNLTCSDPVWRKLLRDVRFRRALSLAINRTEINRVMFFGLATPTNNTVLPKSPLFKPEYRESYIKFDVKKANALLDEVGLTKRNDDGIRLMPDGRPLEIIVETMGENPEHDDMLELISDSWKQIGVKLFVKGLQREVLRNRAYSGETVMSIFNGVDSGLATPATVPAEFVPIQQDSLQWPKWGQYFQTNGEAGEAPDLPAAKELMELYGKWVKGNDAARKEAWQGILDINAENMFSIGLIGNVPQPVVVRNDLRNVPEKGIHSWEPGAFFGIYRPDTFWWDR